MTRRPPNILFLMSDQHRADVAGFAGNEVVRTPVLDALAAGGVVFDHCYTPSPICVPARQCIMSGQLPMTCGCRVYGDDLPPFSHTFARQLAIHGYSTVCAGKLHHMGMDQMQGWTQRLGWADMHVYPEKLDGMLPEARREFYPEGKSKPWTLTEEIRAAGPGENPYAINDDYTVDGTLRFIREWFTSPFYQCPQKHRPLLLKVSLQRPHYPFVCREDLFDYYHGKVPVFTEADAPEHRCFRDFTFKPDVTVEEVRRATAAYYGMVEEVDAVFGRVLEALQAEGEDLDDWVIVFCSDHGEMLGERGTWWKLKFLEGSVRAPLFIRAPRWFAGGKQVKQNVSLCDLYATLCDFAGCPIPEGVDSRSLLPLLRGEEERWPDEAVAEMRGIHLMIKRSALKYQRYAWDEPEVLFDLEKDPGETRNLIREPEYRAEVAKFRERAAALGYAPVQ